MIILKESLKLAYWGFIIGDALGVPHEFKSREQMKAAPATDFEGGGFHDQPAGTWSDDTSLMLCVLHNISEKGNSKQLSEKFINWYLHGEYSPHGEVFDIGNATREALDNLIIGKKNRPQSEERRPRAGNGALMRCIPYAFFKEFHQGTLQMVMENRITHPTAISNDCCLFYAKLIRSLSEGHDKIQSLKYAGGTLRFGWRISGEDFPEYSRDFSRIFSEGFSLLQESDISSSGYVLHTLEAATWCFMNTNSYKECVLKAVNLGEDTDTIAALSGALAAVYYKEIPAKWKRKVINEEWLTEKFTNWVY